MKHYNSVSTNACIESQLSYKENCNGTECTLLIPKDINYKRVLPKTNTISIVIILLCVIVGDSARGVLFPTLFSYIKSLGGDRVCQGFAVAAFSVGRILSSPIFGTLSEEYGNRYVLVCCNVIITIGCLLYIISTSYVWVILSQFVIGFGAGSLGVTRSFVAEHTEPENRGVYLAYLTAAQYAGLAVTPILGSIISELAIENSFHIGYLTSNQYTAPSMFIGVAALFICLLLVFLLKDVSREKVDQRCLLNSTNCNRYVITVSFADILG